MACGDKEHLWQYLADFSGQAPVDAVVCFFQSQMGMALFAMIVFGGSGAALSIRLRSIGPLLVTMILGSGIIFVAVPAPFVRLGALIAILGIAVGGYIIYQRSQSAL